MHTCSKCEGFVPQGVERCPNCRSPRSRLKLGLALAGAAITLSACYGPAARVRPDDAPAPSSATTADPDAGH
ncbi:MAG: hypothetical protein QM723_34745 [Myxococcaceae bacterium]